MKISCPFDDQILPDLYTKASDVKVAEKPVVSFPFIIEEAPENTKTFAWTFVDYDSIPVCGFTFIHWVVANVPASKLAKKLFLLLLDILLPSFIIIYEYIIT